MPWSWVYGQERATDALRRAVAADRVAHAYLFHGPEGVGKRPAAVAFAQALQCERRAPGSGDPCGACGPCSKVARMLHPDVQVHLAVLSTHQRTSDGKEPPRSAVEDIAARIAALAEDPYAVVDYRRTPDLTDPAKTSNLKPFYSVQRVREDVNPPLRYAPSEGRFKVVILTDADTLRPEAANAFLKTLEEPNPQTVLILTATRIDRLLPTIVSRCQRVRFDLVPPSDIARALQDRGLASAERAAMLARMAGGSVTQALALAADDALQARREEILEFLRLSATPRPNLEELDTRIKDWSGLGREPLRAVLALMLGWVRDLVLVRASNGSAAIVNVDQAETLQRFVERLEKARLDDMAALIQHAIDLLGANVNVPLVLINLAEGLREAIGGRHRTRLFEPLVAA